jgi:LexA-binding, inner membrane-associated putative hydrolase
MPLPVAHALVGASAAAAFSKRSEARWQLLALSGLLGVCPDFDYFLNWLHIGRGGWHHGFTHSIVFALFAGAVTALVSRWRTVRGFVAFSAATASHPLLDYLMTESRGVSLWWPFTDHRYKLEGWNPIEYTWNSESLLDVMVALIRISLTELVIFAPLLLLILLVRRSWMRSDKLTDEVDWKTGQQCK